MFLSSLLLFQQADIISQLYYRIHLEVAAASMKGCEQTSNVLDNFDPHILGLIWKNIGFIEYLAGIITTKSFIPVNYKDLEKSMQWYLSNALTVKQNLIVNNSDD